MWAGVCTCAYLWREASQSPVMLQGWPSSLCLGTESLLGLQLVVVKVGWPASPRDPSASSSPVLGLCVHHCPALMFVVGTEPGCLCLHGKHFVDWAISPATMVGIIQLERIPHTALYWQCDLFTYSVDGWCRAPFPHLMKILLRYRQGLWLPLKTAQWTDIMILHWFSFVEVT